MGDDKVATSQDEQSDQTGTGKSLSPCHCARAHTFSLPVTHGTRIPFVHPQTDRLGRGPPLVNRQHVAMRPAQHHKAVLERRKVVGRGMVGRVQGAHLDRS